MPVVASIDTTQQIVTLVFAGETSFNEWQAMMDGVLSDLNYVAGMCIGTGYRRSNPAARSAPYSPRR